jgi:hypothetical protein
MESSYHATVHKVGSRWVYHVFERWSTRHPVMIVRGSDRDWRTAFCQAAGTVSSFRSAYEYRSGERDRR